MKTLDLFLEFEDQLTANLNAHPAVVGLVFLGSAADHSRFDEWSDHDFFVFTEEDSAEALRQDLSWLPNFDQIVIRPRETAHGLKVVYRDGHVLEFAVFKNSELEIAAANSFLVTLDKTGDIQTRMQAIADKAAAESDRANKTEFDQEREFELFLCQLLIGVGRARRGEVLIGGQHVRSWAINNLLGLVRHWQHPARGTEDKTDNLNRFRRFEIQYPSIAARVESALQKPVDQAAEFLLETLVEVAGGNLTESQKLQVQTVKERLGWS